MKDRETLLTTLVSLLEEEMGEAYNHLEETTDLREGLGLDSVDVVGLVMRVEHQFRIRLAMEELMEVKRVGQLIDLVEAKLAAKDGATVPAMNDLRTSAA
jgi:acyl carrier protein